MLTDIELREVFHFCFLEHLLKISDPSLYVLKGGVNLRFYFKSPRYSEDMDIDVLAGNVTTLKKNVYKILDDDVLKRKLRTYGIQGLIVNDPSKAKQTETTQRFRLRLLNKSGEELPTKVEFSRRNTKPHSYELSRVDTEIARNYNRIAYLVQHYDAQAAILQKIEALAGRKEVQARDAFDIFLLNISGHGIDSKLIDEELSLKAIEALMSINYKDYKSKVVEFLAEDEKQNYSGLEIWAEIQERVMNLIKK